MKVKEILFFILTISLGLSANATTVMYRSFGDLVDLSEFVVSGEIENIQILKHWKGENSSIFTTLTISNASIVDEQGEHFYSQPMKIRFEGGVIAHLDGDEKIGEEGLRIEGMPEFSVGEKVILFISNNGQSGMPFVGLSQGVFRVLSDDSMADSDSTEVAGLAGDHVLINTADGPKTRKEILFSASKKFNNRDKQPRLISSDIEHVGITSNTYITRQATASSTVKFSREKFVGAIVERKKIKKAKSSNKSNGNKVVIAKASDKDHLFSLGDPVIRSKVGGPVPSPITQAKTTDLAPVKFLEGKGFEPQPEPRNSPKNHNRE